MVPCMTRGRLVGRLPAASGAGTASPTINLSSSASFVPSWPMKSMIATDRDAEPLPVRWAECPGRLSGSGGTRTRDLRRDGVPRSFQRVSPSRRIGEIKPVSVGSAEPLNASTYSACAAHRSQRAWPRGPEHAVKLLLGVSYVFTCGVRGDGDAPRGRRRGNAFVRERRNPGQSEWPCGLLIHGSLTTLCRCGRLLPAI